MWDIGHFGDIVGNALRRKPPMSWDLTKVSATFVRRSIHNEPSQSLARYVHPLVSLYSKQTLSCEHPNNCAISIFYYTLLLHKEQFEHSIRYV